MATKIRGRYALSTGSVSEDFVDGCGKHRTLSRADQIFLNELAACRRKAGKLAKAAADEIMKELEAE